MNIDQRNRVRAFLEIVDGKRFIRSGIKEARTSATYLRRDVLSRGAGNRWIAERLKSGRPAAIGKIGASELKVISQWRRGQDYPDAVRDEIHLHSGVFPPEKPVLDRFAHDYCDACASMDLVAVWAGRDERAVVETYCPKAELCRLTELEPYYFAAPWSAELEGKRVLVVTPFVESIRRQFEKRNHVWAGAGVLPSFELRTLFMPHSDALVPSRYRSWFDMCDNMICRASEFDFDVAIVGAGAASLPLCAAVKRAGKFAIHLGGATQILFGITGKRWDTHSRIAGLRNEYWTRPLPAETPDASHRVERGAYW